MCQEGGNAANGAGLSLGIVEREIAFGGGIEFQHLRYGKPLLETFPDIARQAIAHRQP